MTADFKSVANELDAARKYTQDLLADIKDDEWYSMPGGTSHVAWQVGHLIVSEFSLAITRIEGRQESEGDMFPAAFEQLFGKGSQPQSDVNAYPPAGRLRDVFSEVHSRCTSKLRASPPELANQPVVGNPHPLFGTKIEAAQFCVYHEYMHAGQIGLLRRFLGRSPIR